MPGFSTRTKLCAGVFAGGALLLTACRLDLGEAPIGPPVVNQTQRDTSVTLTISSGPKWLISNNEDSSYIVAKLSDNKSGPISNDSIYFVVFHSVSQVRSVYPTATDSGGLSVLRLYSDYYNDTVSVTVIAPKRRDTALVTFYYGRSSINLKSNAASLKINEYATIKALFLDGENHPIRTGDTVIFSTNAGLFENTRKFDTARFDPAGTASVKLTSRTPGPVTLHAAAKRIYDSIQIVFDTTSVATVGSRQLQLSISRSQLKANNSDTATVTARLTDENSNPVIGDTILFSCSPAGICAIDRYGIIDQTGNARATLRSSKVNGTCVVRAFAPKTNDTASLTVVCSGITVRLEAAETNLRINEYDTITAFLTDASGNPISNNNVAFRVKNGRFSTRDTAVSVELTSGGKAVVLVTSQSVGTAQIFVSAVNVSDSISVVFTNNALGLTASKSSLIVGGSDSSLITATYLDGSGRPVANTRIVFASNAGTLSTASTTTDGAGQATTWLRSAFFATTATVVATTSAGNAAIKLSFVSSIAAKIKLVTTPDNIGINGGSATLRATVTDANNNMVTGADVNFRILKGPGGGEYIDKPVVTTQNGLANALLWAGKIPSMYRGCMISASIGAIADTTKLTISGEPYAISVAIPQSDTVVVGNAGQQNATTFDYNVGAVVCDINGNPVADGTRVNFSAVVSGMAVRRKHFAYWAGLGGKAEDIKPVYSWGVKDVPFEDINNNIQMDANDLKLDDNDAVAARGDDANGDGVCDYDPKIHDLWIDFNGNGRVDSLPFGIVPDSCPLNAGCEPYFNLNNGNKIWADLYPDGVWNSTELIRDVNGNGRYDVPPSGDFRFWQLECTPAVGWANTRFDFDRNDYGIAITTSATCQGGVANAHLTYPRQLARRLIVSVNAESNGISDRWGARFVLPVIVGN